MPQPTTTTHLPYLWYFNLPITTYLPYPYHIYVIPNINYLLYLIFTYPYTRHYRKFKSKVPTFLIQRKFIPESTCKGFFVKNNYILIFLHYYINKINIFTLSYWQHPHLHIIIFTTSSTSSYYYIWQINIFTPLHLQI